MAEKDWIALVKEFLIKQSSGIQNSIFYAEDVGGVKYEFVLELPDDIPIKTGISGSEIVDVNKTLDDTIVNVQRVFPDGEVIVDYSFNAKGKGGDVQALDKFNKILKEGKGMEGVLLEYYDTFPVETTLPTTLENDITIPNTLENTDTPTNLVDDFETYIRNKYKKHFITEFDSMFGPVSNEEAGFNMFVKEDGTVFADRLYLKPESQKKGIGTEIMQELFEWSNKNNQPFQFILMAGYDNLSSPSKTVQTQKAFQEKLKDVPGLEAFPSEQGLLDTNITTYKYTPPLDTPTNVVDDILDGYKTIKLKITDPNGLHTRPATQLLQDVYAVGNQYGVDYPFIMKNGNLIEGGLATLVKENIKFGETLTLYIPENIPNIKFNESNNYYELVNIPDTPTNVVDEVAFNKSEAIDNVNNLVDELPLEETFKKQVKKNTARIGKNVATPSGVMDFIDAWELGVLALAVAAISTNEVDEIPTIIYNQGVKMYNSMLSSVGIPGQVQEKPYNINFEKAIKTFNIAEMFMPTAYVEKAAVKEFKKGQEAGVDISVGLGAGGGVPPMQFKGQEPKQDNGDINNIMVNLIKNISNAQKSYPITSSEMSNFNRNPIQVVAQDTADKLEKVEYDSKEKQKINDIYAKLYKNLSNAGARVQ